MGMKESHGDWLATEHDSELSDKLNEKFEVSGIPSLVVLKGDGTLVTKGGRADVSQHGPDAIEAWGKTVVDLLKGQTFIKVDDTKVAADDVIAACSLPNSRNGTLRPKKKVWKSFLCQPIRMPKP